MFKQFIYDMIHMTEGEKLITYWPLWLEIIVVSLVVALFVNSKYMDRHIKRKIPQPEPKLFAKRGSIIKCRSCNTHLLRLVVDVYSFNPVRVGQFEAIDPQPKPEPRQKAVCHKCGSTIHLSRENIC